MAAAKAKAGIGQRGLSAGFADQKFGFFLLAGGYFPPAMGALHLQAPFEVFVGFGYYFGA
jgi:hypothetical protein